MSKTPLFALIVIRDYQVRICIIKSKWFLDAIHPEGLAKMAKALGDNSGYAQTIFALAIDETTDPLLFVGQTDGKIVEPRGSRIFGWDCVFEPIDSELTYGEMDKDTKNKISHRSKALDKFLLFIKEGKLDN